jgi:pimeloyl-ACP methyl ester carboxylesterase
MSERLAINGVELRWDEWGAGPAPTLLLCHGYTGSSHDFSLHTGELSKNRRVVTLDQRGHGLSTKCGDLESYSVDQLVNDLTGFIEKVGDGPVDLLGHSMGGRVVLGVVLSRPDLVNSLILMDTSAWSFRQPDDGIATMVAEFMEKFDPARGVPENFGVPGPEDVLIEATTPAEWRREKDQILAGTDAYAIKALGVELLAEGISSVRPLLPSITCPTTVLVGSHDHPMVDQAPDLMAELGHGRLAMIDGAYHSPQLTHHEEWRAAIEAHLAWAGAAAGQGAAAGVAAGTDQGSASHD